MRWPPANGRPTSSPRPLRSVWQDAHADTFSARYAPRATDAPDGLLRWRGRGGSRKARSKTPSARGPSSVRSWAGTTCLHRRPGPQEGNHGHDIVVGHLLVLHQWHRHVPVGAHAIAQDSRQLAVGAPPDAAVRVGGDVGREDPAKRQREHVTAGQRQRFAAIERLPLLPDDVTVGTGGRPVPPGTGRVRAPPGRWRRPAADTPRRRCEPSRVPWRLTRQGQSG